MDIWKDLGITSNNSSKHKCFEKAYLQLQSESGIVEREFPFETISNELYTETASMINMEYSKRTKTIFTPFYWFKFCKGAKIRFVTNEILTIKDILVVNDSAKALNNKTGILGVQITF